MKLDGKIVTLARNVMNYEETELNFKFVFPNKHLVIRTTLKGN